MKLRQQKTQCARRVAVAKAVSKVGSGVTLTMHLTEQGSVFTHVSDLQRVAVAGLAEPMQKCAAQLGSVWLKGKGAEPSGGTLGVDTAAASHSSAGAPSSSTAHRLDAQPLFLTHGDLLSKRHSDGALMLPSSYNKAMLKRTLQETYGRRVMALTRDALVQVLHSAVDGE